MAGLTGFATGALSMVTAPISIAEHVFEKGKEKGAVGLAEAGMDIITGTVGWVTSIPGRVMSGSPSEIGKVAGEIFGGVVGGKLMEAPVKIPGKVYGEVRFWGKEYVPFEKIAHPDVASGKTEFTPVSIVEKGEFVRPATPNEAVQATIKQFYENPTKEAVEIGQKYPALGWHGSPVATEMGKKGTLEVEQGKPRATDVPGLYISGQAMDFFLKVKEYVSTLNPIEAIKSTVQTIKEEGVTGFVKEEIRHMLGLPGKEGFIAVGLKGVKEVPAEFTKKGLEGYKEFFEKEPIEPGFAYIEPKTGIWKQTWEHQAVVPKGALLENIHGKGFKAFTKVEVGGKELKVPIYEMAYERVAEWRLPEAVKATEKAREVPKKEIKPFEEVLKEYGFKERTPYAGPRAVLAPPALGVPETRELPRPKETPPREVPKAPAFEIPREFLKPISEIPRPVSEILPRESLKEPKYKTPSIIAPEIPREFIKEPRYKEPPIVAPEIPKEYLKPPSVRLPVEPIFEMPREAPRSPERSIVPEIRLPPVESIVEPISSPSYSSPSKTSYPSIAETVIAPEIIYGPMARGKGIFGGEITDITRFVLYQEGRKKEEPYRVPDIDLSFFRKINPVGELLGGRFKL
jgi:hypothetical protein